MRRLIAAACSAGVAVVAASPAIAAAPPPTVPSDSAIAQYIEAVPSATGPVPIGGAASPASSAALPTAVRAKVERTAGADAPALLQIAQDPKFGARPVRRVNPTRAIPRPPVLESTGTPTPSPFAAATSTAGSGELLVVALMLVAITAAGIAARVRQR